MTTYTFRPTSSSQTSYAWHDPAIWDPAVVPNAPDADVVIPTVTKSDGSVFLSSVGSDFESFAIHSLSLTNNTLFLDGSTLSVGGNVALLSHGELVLSSGGILAAASLSNAYSIHGNGQITVSGTLSNAGLIDGEGLTVTAQQLNNTAVLTGGVGGLTLNLTGPGFNGTLEGGTYGAFNGSGPPSPPGTLRLNVGGLITADAAAIQMTNGEIFSFDPGSSSYVPIESTLNSIAPTGSLSLSLKDYNWIPLTDSGLITIGAGGTLNVPQITVTGDLQFLTGILSTPQLIVDSNGHVEGAGTINGSVANSGVIAAQVKPNGIFGGFGELAVNGSIAGSGQLEIGPALIQNGGRFPIITSAKLDLNGTVSQNVVFDDGFGTLTLGDPTHFTGSIKPVAGDKVILNGIDVHSITSDSYSGDAHGGTLTLQQSTGHIDLQFSGVFDTSSFTLSAGPQDLSTSPPSLLISGFTPPPLPANPGNVDEWILKDGDGHWAASAGPGSHPAGSHVAAVADFTGDGFGDILWQNVNTGAVDLWKMNHGGWAGSVDLGTHPGSGWQIAGAGDFNHDGTSDVLWFNATTGDTDIWQLSNGQWAASVSPGSHPLGYQVAGIGDFNHDGTSDVLWFNPTTRDVDEWTISNGHWAGSNDVGIYPSAGYQIAGAGDFNNDGAGDVFWYNPNTGATDIWLLQNGKWSASVSPGNHPTGWNAAGVGDFNGDGTSDVLWYNPATHAAEEWIISNGHWAATIDLGAHPGSATIAGVGDFNGGGTSDVLWHQFV